MKIIGLTFFVGLSSIIGCNCQRGKVNGANQRVKIYTIGSHVIKELHDSAGFVIQKQSFNKDTVPDGAMIEYRSNGKIAVWRWFDAKYVNPSCGVFYKEDGSFDTLKGNMLLGAIRYSNGSLRFKIANPPQLTFIIKFIEYDNSKKINEELYDPIKTDSVAWLPIKYVLKPKHEYKIAFCVVDSFRMQIRYEHLEAINIPKQ